MRILGCLHRYVGGQIACRSLRPFSVSETVIVTIPGGPGLSGLYLEPFLQELSSVTRLNVALVDLPNHGESVIARNGPALDYPRTVELLRMAMEQIAKETGGIVLFGQSLGARLAFDLSAAMAPRARAVVLTGFPSRFENSSGLATKLADVEFEELAGGEVDEAAFAKNWSKVLPHYTPRPLPSSVFQELIAGTKWLGNERMLDAAPPLDDSAARVRAGAPPTLVIQGQQDLVVPDDNIDDLKKCLPWAEFREMPDAGHFVMVEKPAETIRLVTDFIEKAEVRP